MSYKEARAFMDVTGLAKPHQYSLFFAGPFDLIPTDASKRLTINCEECFFPSKNIFTSDVRHYGHMYKYPYSQEYTNEVTMIFRVGSDMYEKRVFEEWMNMIIDKTTKNHEYYDNYTTRIGIAQIDNSQILPEQDEGGILENVVDRFRDALNDQLPGNPFGRNEGDGRTAPKFGYEQIMYECVLEKAFPIGVMELPLGHGSTDTYHRIGVTFTFKKWHTLPEILGPDLRTFSERNSRDIDDAFYTAQKQGSDGGIINVLSRGVEQYGPAFRSSRGLLSF